MRVYRDDQGHLPTYVIIFSEDADPAEEFVRLYAWANKELFAHGSFAFDFQPTPGCRYMVVLTRPKDVELFLYGFSIGSAVYRKLWLDRVH
jgi:hypothetical protein